MGASAFLLVDPLKGSGGKRDTAQSEFKAAYAVPGWWPPFMGSSWSSEQPDLLEGVPAHGRGVGTR